MHKLYCCVAALSLCACDSATTTGPGGPTEPTPVAPTLPQMSADGGRLGRYVGGVVWPNPRVVSENAIDLQVPGGIEGRPATVDICIAGEVTRVFLGDIYNPTVVFDVLVGFESGATFLYSGRIYEPAFTRITVCRSRLVTIGYHYLFLMTTDEELYDEPFSLGQITNSSIVQVTVDVSVAGTVARGARHMQFDVHPEAGGSLVFNVMAS